MQKNREARKLTLLPRILPNWSGLEIETRDQLHQSPARIIRVRRIRVGRRHLHKLQVGRCDVGRRRWIEKVDVIEGVQELRAQFIIPKTTGYTGAGKNFYYD